MRERPLIPSQQLLDCVVPRYIPSMEGCLSPEAEKILTNHPEFFDLTSKCLVNTSRVIDAYVEILEKHYGVKHFAIGPLNLLEMMKPGREIKPNKRHGYLEWLNKQEIDYVVYIYFGTSTTMSCEQIRELGIGLERSGQKFLWVLRNSDKHTSKPHLEEGYEERVKGRGVVVRDWAPQLEILAHPSTGGFISHCGWNSCIESISMGVPIATFPMLSDQPANALLVTEVLRLGIVLRDWEHRAQLVTSSAIESVVRRLMASKEGEDMRKRATEVGEAARGSLAQGGASRSDMDSFIAHVTRLA